MEALVVTPKEAARLIKVSVGTMYELLDEGIVRAYIDKGRWKIPVKSLEKYIEERLKEGA